MEKIYKTEKEGQISFFDNFGVPWQENDGVLVENCDGVYNGVMFEFKLNINDLNKTLFQAIKYLSRLRVHGESVPAAVLLVSLNNKTAYKYNSQDYFDEIHKIYTGAASKNNDGFCAKTKPEVFEYSEMLASSKLKKIVKNTKTVEEMYMPVEIDENCVVGWAERYYREIPNASKGDFLGDDTENGMVTGEIREPRHFKGLILPYNHKTNERFKKLMDCLNDRLSKKDLGAFYTPEEYAKKAAELVIKAVERVPKEKDYVIIDRCVDEDTEYFNGEEWKKIKDYKNGENVLTWYPDGHATIELPKRYINKPADEPFFHYVSNTLDMCLSGSHNIVYEVEYKVKENPLRKKPCYKVFEQWNKDSNGFRGRIPLTFSLEEKVKINEDILRVAIMINADGSYRPKLVTIDGSCKNPNNPLHLKHDIYEVRVYKKRKIERCRKLLNTANIDFIEKPIPAKNEGLQGVLFRFRFPFNAKHFPKEWIYLSKHLKEVFLEELMYWDGSISKHVIFSEEMVLTRKYSSSKKEDIDIVQMIAHSCGLSTRIREDKRRKNVNYKLSLRSNCYTKMTKENKNPRVMHTGTFTQETKERKYCFETNSGYLILRRNNKIFITGNCAGTGSLESALIGLKDSRGDDLISHCVVSTYEYYEYKVLNERLGDKVRDIVPSTEADIVFGNGKILNVDAMAKEYIENEVIKQYVDDEDCAVILFENPPYRDEVSDNSENRGTRVNQSFVFKELFDELKNLRNSSIATARDLSNQFIYSGVKHYLRQDTDSYIVFSPIKYWKTIGLIDLKFEDGFLFNRKGFHATESAISCILWSNKPNDSESITLHKYNIPGNEITDDGVCTHTKAYDSFSEKYFDCNIQEEDEECGVFCEADGTETSGRKCSGKSYYNENIIAYMRTTAMAINAQQRYLTRQKIFNAAGFYLRRDTYIEKLPMFAAKLLPQDSWDEKDVYFTTSDGGDTYTKDNDFLKACLFYTVLSNQNKCLSFLGSDGRMYQNELCLDSSKYERTKENAKKEGKEIAARSKEETEMLELLPVAYRDLAEYEKLDDDEKELFELWKKILEEARETEEYNPELNYGVYQITKELNTFTEEKQGKGKKKVYDYPLLNGDLNTLRTKLKEYYKSHIREKMFKYQLIK